jgi:hypothetical protein
MHGDTYRYILRVYVFVRESIPALFRESVLFFSVRAMF